MDNLEMASFVASAPVIMFITKLVKGWVPNRFRAAVPLAIGVVFGVGLSFYSGVDMVPAVMAGLGMGGFASSARDGVKDLKNG